MGVASDQRPRVKIYRALTVSYPSIGPSMRVNMVRFSPGGAFCASVPVAMNPVTAQSTQPANRLRANM
jgi:hypothetical protein